MLENRSFNNLFGKFPGVDGHDHGVEYGNEKPLIRCPEWLPGDLPHDRAAHLNCVNGGTMDGFGTGIYGSTYAYTISTRTQIPNYWLWAKEYAISDNFFASAAGPELPEPLLLHRRPVGRRDRQPREHRDPRRGRQDATRAGAATRSATTCSCS